MSKNQQESGEVDFRNKSGTAWSHNFLNQKPWHPLSYRNQRKKWIQEQQHAQKDKRHKEVQKEFEQQQEFLKTSALLSQKDRERLESMQAVSFMYTRPPGYNPEGARAAELADQERAEKIALEAEGMKEKKVVAKDIFGRKIATEEDFPELKGAPKLDTGVATRVKPFGVEIRNVRCLKCGTMGHQSGDRDCPLKDQFTDLELARRKREDPMNMILASSLEEPLKWELKQQLGACSPPRGGFKADDPNQQILPPDPELEMLDPGTSDQIIPDKVLKKEKDKNRKKKRKEEKRLKSGKQKSKKEKKEKKRRKSDSTESETTSSSESDSDKRKKSRKKKK